MKEGLKELILDGTKEFNEKEGFVTIEFSTHEDHLDEVFEYINSMKIKPIKDQWVAYECDTCVEYNGPGYVHVAIEPEDSWYHQTDRIIRTQNV